jgi:hydroxyacylglutathione hydrolase
MDDEHSSHRSQRDPGASASGTSVARLKRMRIHRLQSIEAFAHLIEAPDALYLVDAGMTWHGRAILRAIERLGRRPEELRAVIVTHAHADHFGGLGALQDAAEFEVLAHPEHVGVLERGEIILSPALNPFSAIYAEFARRFLPRVGLPCVRHVTPVAHGERLDQLGLPGRILHTPGHSAGDISLLLDDGRAFVGDTVQGRRIPRVTPPELPNMAQAPDVVLESWRLLLDEGATELYPAHGSVVTAEEIAQVLERIRARSRR